MILARILGRSTDRRHLVLQQLGPGGTIFRWPAPRGADDADGESARVTVRPGVRGEPSTFEAIAAGSYYFFRSPALELALFFPLLPALPPTAEVTLELLAAEENEGVDEVVVGGTRG